jgi:hypothetical protein
MEQLEYRYIGHIELDDPWFPKPTRAQGIVGHEVREVA